MFEGSEVRNNIQEAAGYSRRFIIFWFWIITAAAKEKGFRLIDSAAIVLLAAKGNLLLLINVAAAIRIYTAVVTVGVIYINAAIQAEVNTASIRY
ncbi:hypothetical protein Tco_1182682 [Tanacetum coccineum]